MIGNLRNTLLALGVTAMAASSVPAQAQFGDIFRDARRGAEKSQACEEGRSGDMARGIIGGILGGATRRTARSARIPSFAPVAEFTDQLTTEIACVLNPEEQRQAADATIEAVRGATDDDDMAGPPVGQSASWTSETRQGVSGTSTVTARESDRDCIMVTDVVIVEGEETRAEKRMCRPPGSARYSIVA